MKYALNLCLVTMLWILPSISYALGPFDFSDPEKRRQYQEIVESYHFDAKVENLKGGMTGTIWEDLNYVLRVFPNHPRALNAMARLFRQNPRPDGVRDADVSPEYYFRRAIELYPRVSTTYIVYGIHLYKLKKYQAALEQFKLAEENAPNSPEAAYNLGLAYLKVGKNKEALKYAQIAYAKDYPLPGLQLKLKDLGLWKNASK